MAQLNQDRYDWRLPLDSRCYTWPAVPAVIPPLPAFPAIVRQQPNFVLNPVVDGIMPKLDNYYTMIAEFYGFQQIFVRGGWRNLMGNDGERQAIRALVTNSINSIEGTLQMLEASEDPGHLGFQWNQQEDTVTNAVQQVVDRLHLYRQNWPQSDLTVLLNGALAVSDTVNLQLQMFIDIRRMLPCIYCTELLEPLNQLHEALA